MSTARTLPDLTLDQLRDRCKEVDGCLIWAYAQHRGRPVVFIKKTTWQVRRLVWALTREKNLKHGNYPAMTCIGEGCIHPDHMEERKRNDGHVGKHLSVTHKAKTAAARRRVSELSDTAVAEIRASNEPLRVLSERHDKSTAWLSKIRQGIGRRDYSTPFSQLVR